MKNKVCRLCKESLPLSQFTSAQAKYCRKCLIIHKLEKRNEMMKRSLERSKTKKPKVTKELKLSDLKNSVQRVVNKYARLRDAKLGCISCSTGKADEGGHYLSVGANSAIRFNLDNIHGQCTSCNRWKHGNSIEYRIALVKKIGLERVEWLEEHRKDVKKWMRDELENIAVVYKQKIKELESKS